MLRFCLLAALLLAAAVCDAWTAIPRGRAVTMTMSVQTKARSCLARLVVGSAAFLGGHAAFAAVGEGGLPDGPIAFQKVLKYQADWKKLADALRPRIDKVDDKEITSIKFFLKQMANEYSDMELLSKSITDKTKAAQAVSLAKNFRSEFRALDDQASAGNVQAVVDAYPATAKEMQDFLDLLSDVPDEL